MKKSTSVDVQKISQLGILTAIIFIMMFTPLGFLKVGVISITFLMIPVSVGAIITGPKGGAFLGAMFGFASFLTCILGIDPFGVMLLSINPIFTAILTIVPRTFMGFFVGVIFDLLNKLDKTKVVSYAVASMSGAILNTVLFVIFLVMLFGSNKDVLGAFKTETFVGIIVTLITFNALIEAAVSMVVGGAISKSLSVYLPKLQKSRYNND